MKRIIMLASCAIISFNAHSHYKTTSEFLKDFLNPSLHQDKTFDYWIDHLGLLVPKKETFAPFEQQIRSALQDPASAHNPDLLFKIFLQHKHIGGHTMQIELLKYGVAHVKTAFKERLALHHRIQAKKRTQLTFLIGVQQSLKHMQNATLFDEKGENKVHQLNKAYLMIKNMLHIYAQPAPKEELHPFDIPSSSYTLERLET